MAGIGVKELGAFVGKMLREEGWLPPVDAESLRSSLRAAEAERDDARALYTETEIAAADRVRDLSREVGAVEDRLRAAEERAEAAERWLAGVREDFRLYAINAERRAEGLEEVLTRLVDATGRVDRDITVAGAPLEHSDSHRALRAACTDARAALARPRSEETPTSPGRGDPWCTAGFNAACSCERCAPAATDKETP